MTNDEIVSYRDAAILWQGEALTGIPQLRLVYWDLAAAYVSISELAPAHATFSAARPFVRRAANGIPGTRRWRECFLGAQ
jgi:hypothetical protein